MNRMPRIETAEERAERQKLEDARLIGHYAHVSIEVTTAVLDHYAQTYNSKRWHNYKEGPIVAKNKSEGFSEAMYRQQNATRSMMRAILGWEDKGLTERAQDDRALGIFRDLHEALTRANGEVR